MSTDNFSPQVPSTVYLDYMEQGIAARKAEAESNASTQGESPDYPGQQVIWRLIQEAGESLRD